MSASVLLHTHQVTKVSAIQVDHADTGSPTSVLITARSEEERLTLGGPPDQVRQVLRAALTALDAADPDLGNQPAHEIDCLPIEAAVEEVCS